MHVTSGSTVHTHPYVLYPTGGVTLMTVMKSVGMWDLVKAWEKKVNVAKEQACARAKCASR